MCAAASGGRSIVGVDGCPAGWLAVAERDGAIAATVHATAADLFDAHRDAEAIAIDVPIGLATDAPRRCDVAARRMLGARRASVFPAPVRAALDATGYADACDRSFAACGRRMSRQAFAITANVREVDALLRADPRAREVAWEVHPELSFALWNGAPMAHPKRSADGFAARLALAEREFPGAYAAARLAFARGAVANDDVLDALAALWTARRIRLGVAIAVPEDRPRDAHGLRMFMTA